MDAGWAQVWLSAAAILISGLFAVWVPYQERRGQRDRESRDRLSITTTRSEPSGLRIDLSYNAEFTHIGLYARIRLASPRGAQLKAMEPAYNPAQIGGKYVALTPGGVAVDDVARIRLVRLQTGGAFEGSMLVLPRDGDMQGAIDKAHLRFEILTDAGDQLLDVKLRVSPVDEARSFWDQPDAS